MSSVLDSSLAAQPSIGINTTGTPTATNCKPVNATELADGYCSCDAGIVVSQNLYTNGRTTATACQGDESALSNEFWVSVPNPGPEAPDWVSYVDPNSVCGSIDNLQLDKAQCWKTLDLDTYVEWWWEAFGTNCTTKAGGVFSDCFLDRAMQNAPNGCADFTGVGNSCKPPTWDQTAWNSERNYYVAVSFTSSSIPL
jgi:hypothetical protein